MKWLISKEEFQADRRFEDYDEDDFNPPDSDGVVTLKKSNDLIEKSFVIYEEHRLREVLNDPTRFHEWVSYDLKKRFKTRQKINYECFCGGYLAFYNGILSSEGKGTDLNAKAKERLLYLNWVKKSKGQKPKVVLLISNPPEGDSYTKSIQDFIKIHASQVTDQVQIDPDPPLGPPPPPDA